MNRSKRIDKIITKARALIEERKKAERMKRWNEYPVELRNHLREAGYDPENMNSIERRYIGSIRAK